MAGSNFLFPEGKGGQGELIQIRYVDREAALLCLYQPINLSMDRSGGKNEKSNLMPSVK